MQTYLLTWNKSRWPWNTLDKDYSQFKETGTFIIDWTCGNTKKIQRGYRVFLLKQGDEPRGVFASGYTISDWFLAPHWNPEREKRGDTVPTVNVEFDKFLHPINERILSRDELLTIPDSKKYWRIASSGIRMDTLVVDELENKWSDY